MGALEGSWYLLTTYNCTYNATYNTPKGPYRGYPYYKPSYKWLLSPMNLQADRVNFHKRVPPPVADSVEGPKEPNTPQSRILALSHLRVPVWFKVYSLIKGLWALSGGRGGSPAFWGCPRKSLATRAVRDPASAVATHGVSEPEV